MATSSIDFLAIALLASFALVGYRLALTLGRVSERLIAMLVRTGMHSAARSLLKLLVFYDEQTYTRSRYIIWNRVGVRFSLLWGGWMIAGVLLFILRAPSFYLWFVVLAAYIGFRWITVATSEPAEVEDPDQEEMRDMWVRQLEVNGGQAVRTQVRRRTSPIQYRQWDYLDELFRPFS
ncbi:hypothetical protein GCM10023189_44650 [Nibrella saemangeumensis]|uniref:Uncharacterized protein n=1 Tax=Nibrella saemangeumensis TaxID=1084526 RepID=A0ABP8NG19_9BACT